jgi:hypothetical protein
MLMSLRPSGEARADGKKSIHTTLPFLLEVFFYIAPIELSITYQANNHLLVIDS